MNKKLLPVLLCAFLFSHYCLHGQTHTGPVAKPKLGTIINGGNLMPSEPTSYAPLRANCDFDALFTVILANLVTTSNGPANTYKLPPEHEPMVLKVTVNNADYCFPLTHFTPFNVDEIENISVPLYTSTVRVEGLQMQSNCIKSSAFSLDWSAKLIVGGEYLCATPDDYPLCNYLGETDIYPCHLFVSDEDEGCPIDPAECSNSTLASFSGSIPLQCGDCMGEAIGVSPYATMAAPGLKRQSKIPNRNFTFSPNPFQDVLRIYWSTDEQPQQIDVTDLNGRLLYSWKASELEGRHSLQLQTASLDAGVYFLRYTDKAGTIAKKLIHQ
ncbi:MAG: T9SS type A sorting domain-containing protein [Bacteroidota bacterium]